MRADPGGKTVGKYNQTLQSLSPLMCFLVFWFCTMQSCCSGCLSPLYATSVFSKQLQKSNLVINSVKYGAAKEKYFLQELL